MVPQKPPLSDTHPQIAAEAMFDPTTLVAGSGKKMPWKCTAHGHRWEATVNSRTGKNNSGCPVCSNRKVLAGFNDLQTTHPELVAEAMFNPTAVTYGSDRKMPWKCTAHGHEWRASPNHRTSGIGTGCPVCSNSKVLAGFNDLQTKYPDIAREANFDPTTVSAGSSKKMPWKCTAHGHEWEASPDGRTGGRKTGCPFCSKNKVLVGFNDLQTKYPDIAREANFDPTTVSSGSNRKMPWRCTAHGHEWDAVVSSRTGVAKTGCPFCSNYKVLAGFNDLHTIHPGIASEAEFDPTTVTSGSSKKMPWKCTAHGHVWEASPDGRTGGRKRGCPFCSNLKVLAGFNDLQTKYPDIAREANFDPTTVIAGSGKKMPWKCTAHGHEWKATVDNRTDKQQGCPFCSNQKVLAGFNDLQTTHPELVAEAMFDPTAVTYGSDRKMPWKCTAHGHEWRASPNNRTAGNKQGCPVCANSGFNPGDPAWLYLARHPEWSLLQVGITNHPGRRLKKHTSNGWEVLDIRGPMDGFLTQQWEASILRWLSFRNIARASSGTSESPHFDNPNFGEAWQESDLNVTSLLEIMDLVEADGH